MYHRVRRKMRFCVCAIILLLHDSQAFPKTVETTDTTYSTVPIDNFENNIIDFDEEYSIKFNKKYGTVPWHSNDKETREMFRYTILKDEDNTNKAEETKRNDTNIAIIETSTSPEVTVDTTQETDYSVIPLELISTTENYLASIVDSTTEEDLSVIPLSTTVKNLPPIDIIQAAFLPTSTQEYETSTNNIETSSNNEETTTLIVKTTDTVPSKIDITAIGTNTSDDNSEHPNVTTKNSILKDLVTENESTETTTSKIPTIFISNHTIIREILSTNSSKQIENRTTFREDSDEDLKDVPVFTELDEESDDDVPEDYYDSKDIVPTPAPKANNALSALVGLAGSVVESVAERVVPKGIFDLFKRMQRQNEALEAEKLRSREENGGLGQFGRGILKSISSGLSKPLSQLMAGVRDFGSLDNDRGFVGSLASGVTSVANAANSLVDSFKDRVQAIYPGTVWCGDGHAATARSELGLFFFTDTCCRQHDACKLYIKSGDTKYGLTNTGLFTSGNRGGRGRGRGRGRGKVLKNSPVSETLPSQPAVLPPSTTSTSSHCSCDAKFRECLHRTNSLVSGQIGLTYFNVLGPQCFRKAHPIVRCVRRTRITGQRCEEYELDHTKPKMWQWFDNETF